LTMTYMQLMAEDKGMSFSEREYDSDIGKDRIKYTEVTFDDLNAAYEVQVDSRVKNRTVTELNERLQMWQGVYKDNPFIDQLTALQMTISDYSSAKKLLPTRERYNQIKEEQAKAAQEAAAQEQGAKGAMQAPVAGGVGGTVDTITGGMAQ